MTEKIDNICAEVFLKDQLKLLPKPVAADLLEATEFLKDCNAVVFQSRGELIQYLTQEGVDFHENEINEILEVFLLPDGRYLYVEA